MSKDCILIFHVSILEMRSLKTCRNLTHSQTMTTFDVSGKEAVSKHSEKRGKCW